MQKSKILIYPYLENSNIKIAANLELKNINCDNLNKVGKFFEDYKDSHQVDLAVYFSDDITSRFDKVVSYPRANQTFDVTPGYLIYFDEQLIGILDLTLYKAEQHKLSFQLAILNSEHFLHIELILNAFITIFHQKFDIKRFEYIESPHLKEVDDVIKRLGFKEEGVLRNFFYNQQNDEFSDVKIYSYILPNDFLDYVLLQQSLFTTKKPDQSALRDIFNLD